MSTQLQDLQDSVATAASNFNLGALLVGAVLAAIGVWLFNKKSVLTTVFGTIFIVASVLALAEFFPGGVQSNLHLVVLIIILLGFGSLAGVFFKKKNIIMGILATVMAIAFFVYIVGFTPAGDGFLGEMLEHLRQAVREIGDSLGVVFSSL